MTFTQSTLLWMAVFALIGASSYVADRKFGVKFYAKIRKWWTPPSVCAFWVRMHHGHILY